MLFVKKTKYALYTFFNRQTEGPEAQLALQDLQFVCLFVC